MAHNRKFVPGSIGLFLIKPRIRNALEARRTLQDDIESLMISSSFLKGAPFRWVGLMYRYGWEMNLAPEYQRINKKWGDLPIAVELDAEILKWADKNNLDLMHDIFWISTLEALIHVGKKYNLNTDGVIEERKKYGALPMSVEEAKLYKSKNPPT